MLKRILRSIDDVSKDLFERYYSKALCYLRRLRTHIEREEYGRADVVAERASKEATLFELEIAEAGDRVSEYTVEQVFGDVFISYLNMRLLEWLPMPVSLGTSATRDT